MKYTENSREIPVKGNFDVIVAGSGPSGVSAAISSARGGASVLLIEFTNAVGGMSTSGLMSHFTGSVDSVLYKEILTRSAEMNEGLYHNKITATIDPEKLKNLYLTMLSEADVKLLLYTIVCDVIMDGNRIIGVITENKSGRNAYYGKVIIDATGDGDVAYHTGAEFLLGREEDNKMQPATLMFKVGGVDTNNAVFLGSFESTYDTPKGELQSLAKINIPHPAGHILVYRTTLPGIVTCNMTNVIDIDGTDAESLTKGEIICRSQLDYIVKYLREFVPGYENCFIVSSGSMIGIRETRHFKGLYTLTETDILEARVFDDWVVRDAHFNFDVHNITGAGLDKTGVQKHFKQNKGYTIPYRCFVPEKIDGLLLTGRCISGTHIAHSNFRVMPICVGMGEACGYAAAISIKNNCEVHDVNAVDIQSKLIGEQQ